jgi:cysteine desulfurase
VRVYLDHNSTSPMRPEVRELWLDVSKAGLGNPSSAHASGRRARAWIDRSRARVAAALAVSEDEIHFTSGATEANNVALQGVAAIAGCDAVVVTSSTEHSSVIEPARELERRGHSLRIVGVAESGAPTVDDVVAAARGAALVSIASANNETGAVTDIAAITRALGPERPLLHTDAVQALGRIPVHLNEWGVDLASFSAHKVGGPPGVGVLWRRKGVPLAALCLGGGQEGGIRPGTEDVAGIAAAALAIELAVQEQGSYAERVAELTRELWSGLCTDLPGLRLLGPPIDSPRRLPNTLCLLVPGTDGRVLVTRLDLEGLEVSAGSACASGSIEPSHVLLAMGLSNEEARAALRVSLGRTTTREECKRARTIFGNAFSSSRAT